MEVKIMEAVQNEEHEVAEVEERTRLLNELGIESEESKKIYQFPEFTTELSRVYSELLPQRVLWNQHGGYIPTPVLKVITEQKDNFHNMYILSDRKGDPILIGNNSESIWKDDYREFLLAVWGPVLLPFEELKKRAMELWIKKRAANIQTVANQVEVDALRYFNGESVSITI